MPEQKRSEARPPEALPKPCSPLTLGEALVIIGGLSNPSKMPWYSWSISAHDCVTGSKLREIADSVCSKCYAMKGNYVFRNVKEAHARRKAGLANDRFVEAFVTALTLLYEKQKKVPKENRFRWHDAGDLQDLEHLTRINSICEQTPFLVHYLPTKETGIVREWLKQGNVIAPNLFIKLSFPTIGGRFKDNPFPRVSFSTAGVEGDADLFQCVAPKQGNQCLDCRACWTTKRINYHVH